MHVASSWRVILALCKFAADFSARNSLALKRGCLLFSETETQGSGKPLARKESVKAAAYLRTSSAANVGADKDSEKRQRAAIESFALAAEYELVDTFYDEAVSGADQVTSRPGFAAMMERIAGNGVRTVIVETANRFARDLIVQETGYALLKEQGIELIAADKPDAFLDDTPTAILIRQVLGAVSQFEKAMVVTKLKGARDRKRLALAKAAKEDRTIRVKVEGRKSYGNSTRTWCAWPSASIAIGQW
jgi:DNA invertase Pin-like site-specific DNA recombinase